jgi:molybdopterin synthase catalytic subunit
MKVTVRLFASVAEAAGFREMSMELPAGATVDALLVDIVMRCPALRRHAGIARIAVNREYAPRSHPLHDGDEVALIPPISGGKDD